MTAAKNGNGYDPDRTRECVDRIEALDRKRESLHMDYMRECAVIADDKKDIYTEAKAAWGIPTRALKRVIKVRATERKLEEMRSSLEADDQESFDQIRHALGDLADTPLGRAATGEDDEADLRGNDQKEKEALRKEREASGKQQGKASTAALNAAAGGSDANAAALAVGIKPLHS